MCGIIGIIGKEQFSIKSELLKRLKKLEYRGYDSSGFATPDLVMKEVGQISTLINAAPESQTNIGIAHSRWATHGGVTKKNAHPHQSCDGNISIVHNGIIENYEDLKKSLIEKGHTFISETDTEVIAHYFEEKLKQKEIKDIILDFILEVKGTFAILLIKKGDDKIYAIKRDSPLVLGICNEKVILASDIYAFSDETKKAIFFENDEFAIIEPHQYMFFDKSGEPTQKKIQEFEWESSESEEMEYPHYMIKEIYEQAAVSKRLLNSLETNQTENAMKVLELIQESERVIFLACGTSHHAGMLGEELFNFLGKQTFSINAADFKPHLIHSNSVVIPITQSGETMDVVVPLKAVKEQNIPIAPLVNVPYSTIQRLSTTSIEISAGQEICVASTKAFTNQAISIFWLAAHLGYHNDISKIPEKINETIKLNEEKIKIMAKELKDSTDMYVMGKGILYPIAREVALKIKEISYIHAEGIQAGELKHGTIALIEKGVPAIAFSYNNDPHILGNTKEVEARGATTILIGNKEPTLKTDYFFQVPDGDEFEFALYANVVGQLIAYYLAKELGRPIDKPRNLAKSCTVL